MGKIKKDQVTFGDVMRIVKLRQQGLSLRQISTLMKLTPEGVRYILLKIRGLTK